MADPTGLLIADAAARAVEFVGLPEAQLNLAHAVVYLATAPKSNRVTTAIFEARADVRKTPTSGVPLHLRDGHYQGASELGHGVGYRLPHNDPTGWVEQQYRPAEVADRRYYEPSPHGREARLRPATESETTEASEPVEGAATADESVTAQGQEHS